MPGDHERWKVKCRAVSVGIVCALIVIGFAGLKLARNVGVERATREEETAVLRSLDHSSARDALDAWFWGVNHHSGRVVGERSELGESWDDVKRLEVLSVKEVKPASSSERCYSVRFRPYSRFGRGAGFTDGTMEEWMFYLRRQFNCRKTQYY